MQCRTLMRNTSWTKGSMATYFNYTIRNRMIDLMHKQNKQQENLERYKQEKKPQIDDGNHNEVIG